MAKMPTLNRGSPTVLSTNPLVRTRVRYSRLMTSQILRMRLRYLFDENIVQGRLNQFEARQAHARARLPL